MADFAKQVVYGGSFMTVHGPKGGCSVDLSHLLHASPGAIQDKLGVVSKATGVPLYEMMKLWAEGDRRLREKERTLPITGVLRR